MANFLVAPPGTPPPGPPPWAPLPETSTWGGWHSSAYLSGKKFVAKWVAEAEWKPWPKAMTGMFGGVRKVHRMHLVSDELLHGVNGIFNKVTGPLGKPSMTYQNNPIVSVTHDPHGGFVSKIVTEELVTAKTLGATIKIPLHETMKDADLLMALAGAMEQIHREVTERLAADDHVLDPLHHEIVLRIDFNGKTWPNLPGITAPLESSP